jgi:nitroreductase
MPSSNLSVLDAIRQRRAVRSYTDAVVPREVVTQLLDAAVHAPTAMHLEPWAFVVVQDKPLLTRISDRAKALLADAIDHHGLALPAIGAARPRVPDFDIFYDASTLIVICGRPLGPFVAADCWLAAENLMLAATALGYATCPIGFAVPALADPEVKGWLDVPAEITAVAPILVGTARATPPPQPRRPPQILRWVGGSALP